MKPGPEFPAFQPLYRQIKALITQSLMSGEWRPGEPIPSEIELASRFSVSQGTVRKAVSELAEERVLVRQQGTRHVRRVARGRAQPVPVPAHHTGRGRAQGADGPAPGSAGGCAMPLPPACWA